MVLATMEVGEIGGRVHGREHFTRSLPVFPRAALDDAEVCLLGSVASVLPLSKGLVLASPGR